MKKLEISTAQEQRIDVSIDCSSPQLTDQSYAQSCDINNIMAQYAKTGMLPLQQNAQPSYIDNTMIPNLEEAFNIVKLASEAFYELPAYIRRQMDNDPAMLEIFVSNPENEDVLIKYGVLKPKEPVLTHDNIGDKIPEKENPKT